jgi:type I restriction enzyme S subunit
MSDDHATISLSDLAEVNPKVNLKGLSPNELVSFIPMADLREGGGWLQRQTRPLKDVRNGFTPFVEGDVLFAKITPCMENGKGAHARGLVNGVGFGTTELHVLRAREATDSRFLYHWLQASRVRCRAVAFMGGSAGQQRVQADFFDHYRVPRIEPEAQARIGSILDLIDNAIDRTQAVIAKLKCLRVGLLQDLFTCGFDANGELRCPVSAPQSFVESAIGLVPLQWTVRTIKEVLRETGGKLQTGPFGSQLHANEYVPEGVPVIMPQDILQGRIDTSQIAKVPEQKARSMARHRVCARDVVLSRRGDLSRAAPITPREQTWMCGTGCFLIRFASKRIDTRWFAEAYRSFAVQRQIAAQTVGTTMPSLNNGIIENLKFAWPTPGEQSAIADRLEQHDRLMSRLADELNVLCFIKSGLTHDLLLGDVRVPTSRLRSGVCTKGSASRTVGATHAAN